MRKLIPLVATLGLLLGLAACNTVAGAGKDLQQGGKAVTNQAKETQKTM